MRIVLKPGRESSLLRRHPWIFSGAIERLEGQPAPGQTVDVFSADGRFLARAAYSPHSQIRARVWTFQDEPIDADFFRRRIRAALARRTRLQIEAVTNAYRLIHAESDGLPGLIVDRYADLLVLQALTAGVEAWKQTLADLLVEETGLSCLYERSDAEVRTLEGLPSMKGPLRGPPPSQPLTIIEHGLHYQVDPLSGHKTGFYLDQRRNRARIRALARDREVLDAFCYTGGFTLNALAGGATSVLSVDSSAQALAWCRHHVESNPLPAERHAILEGDVFQVLRKFRDQGRQFDLILLDPPKFAPTAAQAGRAARAYKDLNLLAFKLLRPGGMLVTFSCSGGIDAALFQKIVADAALDAGADARIVEHLSQDADHPIALAFPEGAYLKGLVCLKE